MTALFPLGDQTPRGTKADFDLVLARTYFEIEYENPTLEGRQSVLEAILNDIRDEEARNYPGFKRQHLAPMRILQSLQGFRGAFDVISASPHPKKRCTWLVEHRRLVAMTAGVLSERPRKRRFMLVERKPNRSKVDRLISRLCAYPWPLLFQSPGSIDVWGQRPYDERYPLNLDIAAYLRATARRRLWEGYGIFRNSRKTPGTQQEVSNK